MFSDRPVANLLPFHAVRGLVRQLTAVGARQRLLGKVPDKSRMRRAPVERNCRASDCRLLIQEPALRPSLLVLLGLSLLASPQSLLAQVATGEVATTTIEADEPRQGPPPPLPELSDPNGRAAEALNEPSERSSIPKVLRSSGSKAGGPANDLNPSGQAEAPAPPKGDLGKVAAGKELFHGNYCGKGQRGEGLPPIDALDSACMRHDACYDTAGYSSCTCDAALRREAASVSDDPDASLETRRRALSVTEATAAMDCRRP